MVHVRRRCGDASSVMTTVRANGVTLGVEHFGDAGSLEAMLCFNYELSDDVCRRLAVAYGSDGLPGVEGARLGCAVVGN